MRIPREIHNPSSCGTLAARQCPIFGSGALPVRLLPLPWGPGHFVGAGVGKRLGHTPILSTSLVMDLVGPRNSVWDWPGPCASLFITTPIRGPNPSPSLPSPTAQCDWHH